MSIRGKREPVVSRVLGHGSFRFDSVAFQDGGPVIRRGRFLVVVKRGGAFRQIGLQRRRWWPSAWLRLPESRKYRARSIGPRSWPWWPARAAPCHRGTAHWVKWMSAGVRCCRYTGPRNPRVPWRAAAVRSKLRSWPGTRNSRNGRNFKHMSLSLPASLEPVTKTIFDLAASNSVRSPNLGTDGWSSGCGGQMDAPLHSSGG